MSSGAPVGMSHHRSNFVEPRSSPGVYRDRLVYLHDYGDTSILHKQRSGHLEQIVPQVLRHLRDKITCSSRLIAARNEVREEQVTLVGGVGFSRSFARCHAGMWEATPMIMFEGLIIVCFVYGGGRGRKGVAFHMEV